MLTNLHLTYWLWSEHLTHLVQSKICTSLFLINVCVWYNFIRHLVGSGTSWFSIISYVLKHDVVLSIYLLFLIICWFRKVEFVNQLKITFFMITIFHIYCVSLKIGFFLVDESYRIREWYVSRLKLMHLKLMMLVAHIRKQFTSK